jgi:hypothetical protein
MDSLLRATLLFITRRLTMGLNLVLEHYEYGEGNSECWKNDGQTAFESSPSTFPVCARCVSRLNASRFSLFSPIYRYIHDRGLPLGILPWRHALLAVVIVSRTVVTFRAPQERISKEKREGIPTVRSEYGVLKPT